jgi:hypothetical protein
VNRLHRNLLAGAAALAVAQAGTAHAAADCDPGMNEMMDDGRPKWTQGVDELTWYNAGDLDPVRRCLRDPRIVVFDQDAIFEEGTVGALNRLLSHVVIGGLAVPALWLWRPYLAGLVGASLYAHVLADLVSTARYGVVVERGADGGRPATDGQSADGAVAPRSDGGRESESQSADANRPE